MSEDERLDNMVHCNFYGVPVFIHLILKQTYLLVEPAK